MVQDMEQDVLIRMATIKDAKEILKIYEPYVKETAITFEYTVPSVEEFEQRIAKITKRYPYLVALKDGIVVGYAYASAFKERAAYDWAVETSIYINREKRGSGVGKLLYRKLEELLRKQNILNVNACIAYPNPGSIAFHEKFGYQTVGHFSQCGFKLNRWYDMIWMEKILAEHTNPPKPMIPVSEITWE